MRKILYPQLKFQIAEYRERTGISQEDMAKKLGILRRFLSQYEKGFKTPTSEELVKICELMEIPIPEENKPKEPLMAECLTCAEKFEVKPNSSGKYCSMNCWYSSEECRTARKTKCQQCYKIFYAPNKNSKFCSITCQGLARRTRPRECRNCGKEIAVITKNVKFCSEECLREGRIVHAKDVGTKRMDKNGYCYIKVPENYPYDHLGWILEHRYVMQEKLGRKLIDNENVHHMDGNRENNDISNLELWNESQPSGQRIPDKLKWAYQLIKDYSNKEEILENLSEMIK